MGYLYVDYFLDPSYRITILSLFHDYVIFVYTIMWIGIDNDKFSIQLTNNIAYDYVFSILNNSRWTN